MAGREKKLSGVSWRARPLTAVECVGEEKVQEKEEEGKERRREERDSREEKVQNDRE